MRTKLPKAHLVHSMDDRCAQLSAYNTTGNKTGHVKHNSTRILAEATKAYDSRGYEQSLNDLRVLDPGCFEFVMRSDPARWARSRITAKLFDHVSATWAAALRVHHLEILEELPPRMLQQIMSTTIEVQIKRVSLLLLFCLLLLRNEQSKAPV